MQASATNSVAEVFYFGKMKVTGTQFLNQTKKGE